jgi:stearoyl-CoA desaturase (delta-9 desaturase)
MSNITVEERDAPIYGSFRELFSQGFELDKPTCIFLIGTHSAAVILGFWLYVYAPSQWVWAGSAWLLAQLFLGSLSTTLYSHRLITHRAVKHIAAPVHWFFCFFGQVFSVQGSVRRWSANHALHHGVDRHGRKELDPYSATWFPDVYRNFFWSHTLTHMFNHPESEEYKRSHNAKRHWIIMLQDKWYGLLTTFWVFLVPMSVGYALGGWYGFFGLMAGSMLGTVAVQHNTWTVNSVTHLWGKTDGLNSSASNNYIWLGPLGEGNHHGDHHDFPKDYRNGFGVSGWLLDPTRYAILALRGVNLVKGLNRASEKEEAEIIAGRKIAQVSSMTNFDREAAALKKQLDTRILELKNEWIDALSHWEKLKKESKILRRAADRRDGLAKEITQARARVNKRKEAFFAELDLLRSQAMAFSV